MKYLVILLMVVACRGPRGDHGDLGSTGVPGQSIVGPTGPAGSNGLNGADGTQITVVQFCKGVAPSYPSTFPESGLCINGNLYGVYSANDGFLAYLPPGAYNSNAIGSSCNFTILPNCQIQ
jgi:hypothetical protein